MVGLTSYSRWTYKVGGQAAWYPPNTSTPPQHRPSPVSSGVTDHKAYIGSLDTSYQVSGRPAGFWTPGGLARGSEKKVGVRGFVCARIVALAETSLPVCLMSRTEQEKLGKEHRSSVYSSVTAVPNRTVTVALPLLFRFCYFYPRSETSLYKWTPGPKIPTRSHRRYIFHRRSQQPAHPES